MVSKKIEGCFCKTAHEKQLANYFKHANNPKYVSFHVTKYDIQKYDKISQKNHAVLGLVGFWLHFLRQWTVDLIWSDCPVMCYHYWDDPGLCFQTKTPLNDPTQLVYHARITLVKYLQPSWFCLTSVTHQFGRLMGFNKLSFKKRNILVHLSPWKWLSHPSHQKHAKSP